MSEVKVPEGYKQTEVGVIPMDWEITTIGNFAPLQRGFDLPTTKVEAGDYPVVYSNGIVRNHKTFQVKGAGIVTGRSGTIGKVHYIENDFWPHNTTLWVTSFGDAHVKFVYYLFKYIGFERFKSGSGVPTLNRNDAHSFKITVPTKVDEQIAIATALSDVDNLIQSLEKLIAKKGAIKTGTMQQLLTGKTRLPEFATRDDGSKKELKQTELGRIPEDWEVTSIKDITRNIIDYRGVTPRKLGMQWGNGNIVALSAGNVKRGYIDFESECYLGSEALYNRWMTSGDTEKDDVVFTLEAPLGNVALIPNNQKYIMSQRTILLQLNRYKYEPKLIYQIFLSQSFMNYISSSATGSTAKGIKRKTFERLKLIIPVKLEEQTAIATILSDIDTEIQALKQRLEKTKDIKQGMMQQLLTGKVRLVD